LRYGCVSVAAALVLAPLAVGAAPITPAALLKDLEARGPKVVVEELWNGAGWDDVLWHVRSGDAEWLRVAVALHAGTDAGSSETLALALGDALDRHAAAVLRIVAPTFGTGEICAGPDIDHFVARDAYVAALDRRISAVSAIGEADLAADRASCLSSLKEVRAHILSPDGPFS